MDVQVQILGDVRLAVCPPDGPRLAGVGDINQFLEAAWGLEADWLVLPISRLGPDFLNLRTGLLGETTQKFVTHRTGLAVIGDISAQLAASGALRDYVRETERGGGVRFAPSLARLIASLS